MTDTASRRRFLAAAAGGVALLFGRPREAAAFRAMPMDADTASALAAACTAAADDHRARQAELIAANLARPEAERLAPADLDALLRRTPCPLCGCALGPLAAAAD